MRKYFLALLVMFFCKVAAQKQLKVTLTNESQVAPNGLYFDGEKGINYQFSPRITPHGDCIDVVNGYVFVTWYKGGIDKRNLMLSRKNLNVENSPWVTIEFPHQHVGFRGTEPTKGDSHNTAAVGISTIDNTIHIIYDMHAYRQSSLPNDFFNYSVSLKNKAFVPDNEFTLDIFNPKQNYLKQGENYERITYPMIHRADDGSLVVRYRVGGSGNGDIFMAHYNGNVWTDNWLFHDGSIPLPNRNNMYGGERFLNGKFYSGFAIRYANNTSDNPTNGYSINSGLYYAYTNEIPKNQSSKWFNADDEAVTLPIRNNINENLDPVKIAEPGDDYGTATFPRTTSDAAWTVTENEAIHFITRVDNRNVHYYRAPGAKEFSSSADGLIPNPSVRGELYSFKNHVFMVEIIGGVVHVKTTLEGESDWKIVYAGIDSKRFMHFDAFVVGNKLYIYLMQQASGDARPLHLKVLTLSEEDAPIVIEPDVLLEAENFTTASNDINIGTNAVASNGKYIDAFRSNQFLEYKFNIANPGDYDVVLSVAVRNRDDSTMDLEINEQSYHNFLVAKTGDWNIYGENKIENVSLNQGENTIRLTQKRSLSSEPDKIEIFSKAVLNTNTFSNNDVSVYPNPSNGIFTLNTNLTNIQYKLINIQGRILQQGIVNKNQLDFSSYSKGIYLLRLNSENNNTFIKRIIIE